MKKLFFIAALFLSSQFLLAAPDGTGKDSKKEELTPEQVEALERIENRVEEIRAMDFSEMSRVEKKEIRAELKTLKAEAKANNNGIYISTGAIIIILLLILIL
ncbi:MAG: hypothetical protein ACQEW9_02775 [Bacteroidota bacterium]|uniref:Seryl-tRNA synthetase n=1 Tax=Algoriphagus faecimaris TaxID=686796 RepID=A0A1G6NUW5_9BACT|nr:hypothetical protein [Algoriphagus faecimaris]SDC71810.1 hypothetical protein SAMN04488104_1004101 [Algoriphagus faecimaris]